MINLPDPNVEWGWTVHAPSADTAAVVALAAAEDIRHVVTCILWSYNATPTGGSLTITDGTTTIVVAVVDQGPGKIDLPRAFCGIQGDAVTVTLAAGGGGVTGRVNVQHA